MFRVFVKITAKQPSNGHKQILQFKRHVSSYYRTKMAAGNLRTAANNDQDDDPRALVPIPIATREMTSLVERLNPGVNAEVVRFVFLSRANCFVFFPNVSLMISATNYPGPERRNFVHHARQRKKVNGSARVEYFRVLAIVEALNRSLRG